MEGEGAHSPGCSRGPSWGDTESSGSSHTGKPGHNDERPKSTRRSETRRNHGSTGLAFRGAGHERAQLLGERKCALLSMWKVESIGGRWGISLQMQLRSYLGFVPHECTVICISA